jgi:hypothetical protein
VVRRTPVSIDCSFQVVNGRPTVHAELVSDHDFALFSRHRDYDSLAMTQTGSGGGFHRLIEMPGRYRVLIVNTSGAPPAAVSLVVRTEVDPSPSTLSKGISARRKLVVILSSVTVFFVTVLWSGRKLLRAYRNRSV